MVEKPAVAGAWAAAWTEGRINRCCKCRRPQRSRRAQSRYEPQNAEVDSIHHCTSDTLPLFTSFTFTMSVEVPPWHNSGYSLEMRRTIPAPFNDSARALRFIWALAQGGLLAVLRGSCRTFKMRNRPESYSKKRAKDAGSHNGTNVLVAWFRNTRY